jgi:hypothetical protein
LKPAPRSVSAVHSRESSFANPSRPLRRYKLDHGAHYAKNANQ